MGLGSACKVCGGCAERSWGPDQAAATANTSPAPVSRSRQCPTNEASSTEGPREHGRVAAPRTAAARPLSLPGYAGVLRPVASRHEPRPGLRPGRQGGRGSGRSGLVGAGEEKEGLTREARDGRQLLGMPFPTEPPLATSLGWADTRRSPVLATSANSNPVNAVQDPA